MNTLPPASLRNLVYMFFITNGMPNAQKIHEAWPGHPVLREYQRVPLGQLEAWYTEFMEEEAPA
jgi:hypothetical protein